MTDSGQTASHAPPLLYTGPEIAAYGFGEGHPFGPDRHEVFVAELTDSGVLPRVQTAQPRQATREELLLFHTEEYVTLVEERCPSGSGYLDGGDTPALPWIDGACRFVVGAVLEAAKSIVAGPARRAFVPIAGLHHGARNSASGFCVYNDIGVVIEACRRNLGVRKIAYVDIDAHHGDGVFYGFEEDPDLLFADIHEDGRFLFPGTGFREESGKGQAAGTKLNIPVLPGADDSVFKAAWTEIEEYLDAGKPEMIILQCGADSLSGDPITHLEYSENAHAAAARSVCDIADRYCQGRVLALGGGGYNRRNLARAWTRVVQELAA